MKLRILFTLLLLLGASACGRHSNQISVTKADCGSELELEAWLYILPIQTTSQKRLQPGSLEAFSFKNDSDNPEMQQLSLSSKNCLLIAKNNQDTDFIIRSKDPELPLSLHVKRSDLTSKDLILSLGDKVGPNVNCPNKIFANDSFTLPIVAGVQEGSTFSLHLSVGQQALAFRSEGRLSQSENLNFIVTLPEILPEGPHTLNVHIKNHLKPIGFQDQRASCSLIVDRTQPNLTYEGLDFGDQNGQRRRSLVAPGALISVKGQDSGPVELYYCLEESSTKTCQEDAQYQQARAAFTFYAPKIGDWKLYVRAHDLAQNRRDLEIIDLVIYDRDLPEIMRLRSTELSLLVRDDPFKALQKSFDALNLYKDMNADEQFFSRDSLSEILVNTGLNNKIYAHVNTGEFHRDIQVLSQNRIAVLNDEQWVLYNDQGQIIDSFALGQPAGIGSKLLVSSHNDQVIVASNGAQGLSLEWWDCRDRACQYRKKQSYHFSETCSTPITHTWVNQERDLYWSFCGELYQWRLNVQQGHMSEKHYMPSNQSKLEVEISNPITQIQVSHDQKYVSMLRQNLSFEVWNITADEQLSPTLHANVWQNCQAEDLQFFMRDEKPYLAVFQASRLSVIGLQTPAHTSCESGIVWPFEQVLANRFDHRLAQALDSVGTFLVQLSQGLWRIDIARSPDFSSFSAAEVLSLDASRLDLLISWNWSEQAKVLTLNFADRVQAYAQYGYALAPVLDLEVKSASAYPELSMLADKKTWVLSRRRPNSLSFLNSQGPWSQFVHVASPQSAALWLDDELWVGDQFGSIQIFDSKSRMLRSIKAHTQNVRKLVVFDTETILSAGEDGRICPISRSTYRVIDNCFTESQNPGFQSSRVISEVLVIPGTRNFISQSDNRTILWDYSGEQARAKKVLHQNPRTIAHRLASQQLVEREGVFYVAILHEQPENKGALLLEFFNLEGESVKLSGLDSIKASHFAVSPNQRFLSWLEPEQGGRSQLKIWDMSEQRLIASSASLASTPQINVSAKLIFSPDSQHLAFARDGDSLRVLSWQEDQQSFVTKAVKDLVYSQDFYMDVLWQKDSSHLIWLNQAQEIHFGGIDLQNQKTYRTLAPIKYIGQDPSTSLLYFLSDSMLSIMPLEFSAQRQQFETFFVRDGMLP